MTNPVKNILFTFDYELFLGKRSGGVDNCVLHPTRQILDILSPHKAKCIFFVDLTWLLKLKEIKDTSPRAETDYNNVVKQIQEIHKDGHYIFPHLHPHWADAIYLAEINQWKLIRYVTFRLHYLTPQQRHVLFEKSIALLHEILGNDYKPAGFRAGGWSIQPFKELKDIFEVYGIKYDFSVLPGAIYLSKGPFYDFSQIKTLIPYTFTDDLLPSDKGKFIEFPISMLHVPGFKKFQNKVLLKYLQITGDQRSGDGFGVLTHSVEEPHSSRGMEMLSIELLNSAKAPLYLNFINNHNYIQLISHPKMLTPNNLRIFRKFVNKIFSKYTIETDFMKCLPGQ